MAPGHEDFTRLGETHDARRDVATAMPWHVAVGRLSLAGVQTGADTRGRRLGPRRGWHTRILIARAGPSNVANAPSPVNFTTDPRALATWRSTMRSWASRTVAHA